MADGTVCRRSAALRVGQRLAAPAAGGSAQGRSTVTPYRELSYEKLVDDFIAALPSANLAELVMRDNPTRLYEF